MHIINLLNYLKRIILSKLRNHIILLAINLIDNVSKPLFEEEDVQISYFSGKRNVYDSFAKLLLRQKKYKKAFELIDRSRSRNTMQNLNNLKLQSLINDKNVLDLIYEYNWQIHSGIYSGLELDSIKQKYALLKEKLINNNPAVKNYLNLKEYYTLPAIQNKLNGNEVLISYYTTKNKTYAFIIENDKFNHIELDIKRKDLLKLISTVSPYYDQSFALSKVYYNQDLFSFNAQAANKFYNLIVDPVLKNIPKDKVLIISPSTELISFPFEFLVTNFKEGESPFDYKNKHYLIQDYDISYIPSAGTYIEQKMNKLKNNEKVLLVGDPKINTQARGFAQRRGLLEEGPGLPRNIALLPLKYSEEEVSQIGSIINVDKMLLSTNATESNFKENADLSSIIHLSTHSFLFNKQPVIFFSNAYDADNDGFLEASEVVQLKLNSDLIVLSSCNSGLGRIDESEGILGMTKAFFEAGAKSVVVSLWEVNDKYTSGFMKLFYQNLKDGKDKTEALRDAKIEFIKDYSPNPYFWAAFVLNGNINKVPLKARINTAPYLTVILGIIVIAGFIILIMRKKKPDSLPV